MEAVDEYARRARAEFDHQGGPAMIAVSGLVVTLLVIIVIIAIAAIVIVFLRKRRVGRVLISTPTRARRNGGGS